MKFAVNIITYNGASRFIEKTIQSIMLYTDEIRVYDTGSTDNTLEVLKKYPVIVKRFDIQHLGKVWTNSKIDIELTHLLNEMKLDTHSEWILKIDDDEIFPKQLMEEISKLEPESDIYSIPFLHISEDPSWHLIKRLFRNSSEINWNGNYGNETLAINGVRILSKKCPQLQNHFLHLGELCQDNHREHNYKFKN